MEICIAIRMGKKVMAVTRKESCYCMEMTNPNILQGAEATSGTDIMEYRYGELLLNVAEC